MRILVAGTTGTLGRAVVAALAAGDQVIAARRQAADVTVDSADPDSFRAMLSRSGKRDALASVSSLLSPR